MNQQAASSPELWTNIWDDPDDDQHWWWVRRDSMGVRGRALREYLRRHLGDIPGRRSIEVGSGPGSTSLTLAREGMITTLLDYSPPALHLAQRYFDQEGLEAEYIVADALDLPKELLGVHDLAMSFGTIEHFRDTEQLEMARAHVALVRPGGVVAISVPNRLFVPHEVLKAWLQRRGKWKLGHEGAFTPWRLRALGKALSLQEMTVVGSGVRLDLARYRSIYANTNALRHHTPDTWRSWPAPEQDRPSRFDPMLGSDIMLLGRRAPP